MQCDHGIKPGRLVILPLGPGGAMADPLAGAAEHGRGKADSFTNMAEPKAGRVTGH